MLAFETILHRDWVTQIEFVNSEFVASRDEAGQTCFWDLSGNLTDEEEALQENTFCRKRTHSIAGNLTDEEEACARGKRDPETDAHYVTSSYRPCHVIRDPETDAPQSPTSKRARLTDVTDNGTGFTFSSSKRSCRRQIIGDHLIFTSGDLLLVHRLEDAVVHELRPTNSEADVDQSHYYTHISEAFDPSHEASRRTRVASFRGPRCGCMYIHTHTHTHTHTHARARSLSSLSLCP